VVATAIVAIVAGATLGAAANAAHAAAGNPIRDALTAAATHEVRVALDVLKYGDATITARTIATAIPMPAGTPLPANLSIAVAPAGNGATAVTVTAADASGSGQRASVTESLDQRAPLPGTQAPLPGLVPAPTGAP